VRGVTVEGLAREALELIRARPDLPWPVAWRIWCDRAQLPRETERQVKVRLIRIRSFGARP
jgi:hypothetical protein